MPLSATIEDGVARVEFFGAIGDEFGDGITLPAFRQIQRDTARDSDRIRLLMNSEGGRVTEGQAIKASLLRDSRPVDVEVLGIAGSMAAQIALAMDRLEMVDGSWLMIHNPWGMAVGDYREMAQMAELLQSMQQELSRTVSNKAKVTESQAQQWMDAESWFSASQAEENGLADAVLSDAEASFRQYVFAHFAKVPPDLCKYTKTAPAAIADEVQERLRNLQSLEVIRRLQQVGAG